MKIHPLLSLLALAILALLGLASTSARADEPVVGYIDATTTSKTNAQATTPFGGASYKLSDGRWRVQCPEDDGEFFATTVSTSTGTVSATTGTYTAAKGIWETDVKCTETGRCWIAVVLVSGSANCTVAKVYR